jgi:hypothetical protein
MAGKNTSIRKGKSGKGQTWLKTEGSNKYKRLRNKKLRNKRLRNKRLRN